MQAVVFSQKEHTGELSPFFILNRKGLGFLPLMWVRHTSSLTLQMALVFLAVLTSP